MLCVWSARNLALLVSLLLLGSSRTGDSLSLIVSDFLVLVNGVSPSICISLTIFVFFGTPNFILLHILQGGTSRQTG